jgi:hypothetical protein
MMGVESIGIAIRNGTDLAATPEDQEVEAADSEAGYVAVSNPENNDDLQSPETSVMDIEDAKEL